MLWAVLLFLYYYGLLVLAPEMGWSFFGASQKPMSGTPGLRLGFWRSCMKLPSGIPGPRGPVAPELNAAAAHYVAMVYGHGQIPRRLRRAWAGSVIALAVAVYAFCLSLLAHASLESRFFALVVTVVPGMFAGGLTLWAFSWERARHIPWSKKTLARQELQNLRQDPQLGSQMDVAARYAAPVFWWPWPQDHGRYVQYTGKILAITLPAAYAVMTFFRANGAHVLGHGVFGKVLLLLALAFEWVLLVSALVWWGDWKGAEQSTRVSFPLRILLNDMEDLAD